MRILILERSLFFAQSLATFLKSLNYETKVGNSLSSAKLLIEDYLPDIVVLGHDLHPRGQFYCLGEVNNSLNGASPQFIILTRADLSIGRLLSVERQGIEVIRHSDSLSKLIQYLEQISKPSDNRLSILISESKASNDSLKSLGLSQAERDIAQRIILGKSSKEISIELGRSVETVQNQRKAIKAKLGIVGGKNSLMKYLLELKSRESGN